MVKRIRLSDDNTTFYTLPGNSGEVSNEAGQLPDTIFGQDFQSNFPGLIGWQIQANGIFKGFAGYQVGLKITGTSTPMTDEATTQEGATKTYQITDSAKQIIDRGTALVINDNGAPVADSDIEKFDYLFGKVTFAAAYTVTGPVTITGAYLPTTTVAGSRSFTLTQTSEAIDETTIPLAQANDGHRVYDYGLKTVSMDITGVYALSNGFRAALRTRNEFILEVNPDAQGLATARGFFRFTTQSQSGNVGELEEETINLVLSVPDDDKLEAPFAWDIKATSTLSPAIQKAIAGWQNNTLVNVKYEPETANVGVTGEAVVTDLSLTGGLEAMNEFTVNLQGSGQLEAIT